MGFLLIPGYHLPLNLALRTPISTGLISLILNLNPAITYFLAVAFRQEPARRERTFGVVAAFGGLVLIFGEEILRDLQSGSVVFSWEGAAWMLLPPLSWSVFTLVGRRIAGRHDARFTFAATGTAGTTFILIATPFLLDGQSGAEFLALEPLDWVSWAYVSLLAAFFAYWVWILALRHYEASRLASVGNIVPLVVHLVAVVFLPEERKALTVAYVIGAVLTLAGTALVVRPDKRPPRR